MKTKFDINVFQNSSEAMSAILRLHFPYGNIVDVNYSIGTFYRNVKRNVIGIDTRPISNIQADNKYLPFCDDTFDIGVADPPYKRGNGDPKYRDRYGDAPRTTKQADDLYFSLIPELIRVSRLGMIIKCQDETDGHKFHHRMYKVVSFVDKLIGLEPHDIFYVVRSGVADNLVRGTRHFSANCVSYFLVYKWSRKHPFKAVRF